MIIANNAIYPVKMIEGRKLPMATETKKLTKTQKAKANQLQKDLLQPIAEHNRDIQRYGEPCINARALLQMWDSGLFADNPDEFIFLLKLNLIAECFRKYTYQKPNTDINQECDTSRLFIGLVIKNYKEMCILLKEDTKTGKAKIKQIENWKRFFDFERIHNSNEYIILDIYPEPFSKGTKRNTQFTNQLAVLILKELTKQNENNEGNIIYFATYAKLIKKLNVVNQFFHKESLRFFISKYPELFKSDSDFESFKRDYNIFKILTKRKIKGAVQSALVNLKKDNLIYYTEYHRIKVKDNYRNATTNEEIYIQSVKKEIAESIG